MTVTSIAVGTDGSDTAQAALRWVADVAGPLGATVTVVHVFDPLAGLGEVEPPVDFDEIERARQAELEDVWCRPLRDAGVPYTPMVVHGEPPRALRDIADDVGADLLVVGARGLGRVRELVLGSTSAKLAHDAGRPVVIIPAPNP